jgi:pimeloyl-ACP methyl ester carboxylesterase
LHGLGTGPASKKAAALASGLAGVRVEQPDLRRPEPGRVALGPMLEEARQCLAAGEVDLLVGASLGGWLALHLAAMHPRTPVLLLAPALDVHRVRRDRPWVARLWRTLGLPVHDKADRTVRLVQGSLLGEIERLGAPPAPRVRVVVLHGRRDVWAPVEASRRFAASHERVVLEEVDDGHDLAAHLPRVVTLAQSLLSSAH